MAWLSVTKETESSMASFPKLLLCYYPLCHLPNMLYKDPAKCAPYLQENSRREKLVGKPFGVYTLKVLLLTVYCNFLLHMHKNEMESAIE